MFKVLFVCGLIVVVQSNITKLVNITQGPVLGYKAQDAEVFEFYGIPYATAPTGRDKFKEPLPAPVWTETFNATDKETICPQFPHSFVVTGKTMKEDCLVANVLVPDTENKNLPVLVIVHGGAFIMGFGSADSPKQLVNSKKVIAVNFNYRLGPHGFLCLGSEDIPGNAGMKDQVALLHWVKENIKYFGGNPDDVTVAGCSAGGGSVDLLLISKMTKGLFQRAIVMSGANVAALATQADPIDNARDYATRINYDGNDYDSLVEFYKNATLDQLNSQLFPLLAAPDTNVLFTPCIERDVGGKRFLHDSPVNIIKNGDYERYPMLYGFSNMEGLFRNFFFDAFVNPMNKNFADFLPFDLEFKNEEERQEVAKKIKEFYFGDQLVSNETSIHYVDFFSDSMFIYPMQRSVKLQVNSNNTDIFLFVYSFVDENSDNVPHSDVQGATHCAAANAAMGEDESHHTPEYLIMKQKMRQVWLDFITTGNPTPNGSPVPTWTPARADRAPCMDFGNTIQMQGTFEKNRTEFWDEIYNEYYRQPMPPSVPSSSSSMSSILGISIFVFVTLVSVLL